MTTDQAPRPVSGGQATQIVQTADAISHEEQRRLPRPRRGWTAIPNRLFIISQDTKALRSPKLRVAWYITERTIGQKGRERGTGIWASTIARHLGLTARQVNKALADLEKDGIIVREDSPTNHQAPKYRLSDHILKRDDEGRWRGGWTKLQNQAWVWMPFLSDRGWRLLVALVRSIEPNQRSSKGAQGARRWATIMRRAGFTSTSDGRRAVAELEYFGILTATPQGRNIDTNIVESVGWRPSKGYGFTSTIYDISGLFSYPDFDRLSTYPLRSNARGYVEYHVWNPTLRTSTMVKNLLQRSYSPSKSESITYQNLRRERRVLAGERGRDNEGVSQPQRGQHSHYTFEEYRDFVLGDNGFWETVPVKREMDGDENLMAWCPWCKGSRFSFALTVHAEGGYGGGHCFNCSDGVGSLAQYIAKAFEESDPDASHREIVRMIKKQAEKHPAPPDQSFKLRVASELATPVRPQDRERSKEEIAASYAVRRGRTLPFKAWTLPDWVPEDKKRVLAHIIDIYVGESDPEAHIQAVDVPMAYKFPAHEQNPYEKHGHWCDKGEDSDGCEQSCEVDGCPEIDLPCPSCAWVDQAEKELARALKWLKAKKRQWISLLPEDKWGPARIIEIDFGLLEQVVAKG